MLTASTPVTHRWPVGEPSHCFALIVAGAQSHSEQLSELAGLAAVARRDLQVVREFLERYFTIENEIKVLQQDKSALRDEFKGRGLDMKTMTAAIVIAKKRQLVPVSRETLDTLISEVEEKLPALED